MSCEMISELLPGLLSGTLDSKLEAVVLTHLASCPQCRGELAFWAQVAEGIQAEVVTMPAGLFREIRSRLIGSNAATAVESLKLAGRALGLAGSACRLAYTVALK